MPSPSVVTKPPGVRPKNIPQAFSRVFERAVHEDNFYAQTLQRLIAAKVLTPDMRVLVACGGQVDKDVLMALGFRHVTISNLDSRLNADQFAPYAWAYQDVEQLTFGDDAFDFAIVHNGLHHCHSPHRGLLELYRVARTGVLVFEPRDSTLVRLGIRIGLGQKYEVASVSHNGMHAGGVGNTQVPNFIYRWTEPEVEKTILSYAPYGDPSFWFMYALRVPWARLESLKNPILLLGVAAALPLLKLFFEVFPKQANGFAFAIQKPVLPRDLHPWLRYVDNHVVVRDEWLRDRYVVEK